MQCSVGECTINVFVAACGWGSVILGIRMVRMTVCAVNGEKSRHVWGEVVCEKWEFVCGEETKQNYHLHFMCLILFVVFRSSLSSLLSEQSEQYISWMTISLTSAARRANFKRDSRKIQVIVQTESNKERMWSRGEWRFNWRADNLPMCLWTSTSRTRLRFQPSTHHHPSPHQENAPKAYIFTLQSGDELILREWVLQQFYCTHGYSYKTRRTSIVHYSIRLLSVY